MPTETEEGAAETRPAVPRHRPERHGDESTVCGSCGWLIRAGADVCTRCGGRARQRLQLSVTEKLYLAAMLVLRNRPIGLDDTQWWERVLYNHYVGRHAGELSPEGFSIATPLEVMHERLTQDAAAWTRSLKEGTCRI